MRISKIVVTQKASLNLAMAQASSLEYATLPERAQKIADALIPPQDKIEEAINKYSHVKPRPADIEGSTEELDGATFTHHFVYGPGDAERVLWHYVEAGPEDAEVIVFLHGIPDSWYQWRHQMASLSKTYRCIGVDLKGYGQSEKGVGDYSHEGVSEQLLKMLQLIGLKRFNLVTHDRGTVQADFIVAKHPENVIRYGRGEQHLYHFEPQLAPQGEIFQNAPWTGIMEDPIKFVCWVYTFVCNKPIPKDDMERVIQEFSYPGTSRAVPRYFNTSTFRQEWLHRRNRLLAAWKCPVMLIQGYDSKSQPREFYQGAKEKGYIPNAKDVQVSLIPGGHFWTLESPDETTEAIRRFMKIEP